MTILQLLLPLLPLLLAVTPAPGTEIRPEVGAAAVLHDWDDRRAAAWAAGDAAGLRSLYAPGSAAGRHDVRMLRAWTARGLRVERLQVQLLRVGVRRATRSRLELAVTDRVVGAVAAGKGRVPVRLPHGSVSTHVLVLVVRAGEWRVEAVLDRSANSRSRRGTSGQISR